MIIFSIKSSCSEEKPFFALIGKLCVGLVHLEGASSPRKYFLLVAQHDPVRHLIRSEDLNREQYFCFLSYTVELQVVSLFLEVF